ncbi:DNA damage-inducible protein 1 [Apiospora sp. TS-2023a]
MDINRPHKPALQAAVTLILFLLSSVLRTWAAGRLFPPNYHDSEPWKQWVIRYLMYLALGVFVLALEALNDWWWLPSASRSSLASGLAHLQFAVETGWSSSQKQRLAIARTIQPILLIFSMEALAALSLAGNVVQFVQFAYGLIHSTSRIYASASGASAQTEHLDYIHNQLMVQYAKMSTDEHLATVKRFVPLMDMVTRSQQVGQQLLDMINELKLKNAKSGKWWKSLWKALREARKRDEVKELEGRIDDLQRAMVLYLCNASGETLEKLAKDITSLKVDNSMMHNERCEQLGELSEAVQAVRLSVQELKSRVWSGETLKEEDNIALITSTIQDLSLTERNYRKENRVLGSLNYSARTTRREAIPKAYEKTFQWALERQCTNEKNESFMEWLEHGNGPFWISGRPGSGKSTLMRFISGHDHTLKSLEKVAAPCRAFIVYHYFWSAGTVMQRSQEGLYRSILLHIIAQVPEVAHVLPGWEFKSPVELARESWGLDQLHAALDALATNDTVHELTLNDIQLYVNTRLKEHYLWETMAAKSHDAASLIADISEKAHGVFLWVFLVTKLLREGLTNDDSILDLRKRLEMIPSDLESFFRQILDSVEPFYHDKMASTLAMALVAVEPLHAELYALGEDEFDDGEYATKQPVKIMGPKKRHERIRTFSRRLNGRCKGLLEISGDNKVTFLHRTVRDFLRTKRMDDFLRNKNRTRPEPRLSIFKTYLSSMKQTKFTDLVEREGHGMFLGTFVYELKAALWYLRDEVSDMDQIGFLIDEMESATITIFASGQAELLPSREPLSPRRLFREFMLIHSPIHYLSRKLASSPKYFIDFNDPPLILFLRYNVDAPPMSSDMLSPSKEFAILKTLLESGADPNEHFFDGDLGVITTPWAAYISRIIDHKLASALAQGFIEELLYFGAAPNAMTQAPSDVTGVHESVLVQAWLNIFFAAFTLQFDYSRLQSGYLEALNHVLEKGADFRSMTLALSSDLPTVTPWERLSNLIRESNEYHKLQVQALAKLAQFSGPDILPWDDLMLVIREEYYTGDVEVIEKALARGNSWKHGLGQLERSKRARGPEEPDSDTPEAKRSKGE